MTPNTPMPFGAFQGQKLKDVPDLYLTKLSKSSTCPDDLKEYINENIQQQNNMKKKDTNNQNEQPDEKPESEQPKRVYTRFGTREGTCPACGGMFGSHKSEYDLFFEIWVPCPLDKDSQFK